MLIRLRYSYRLIRSLCIPVNQLSSYGKHTQIYIRLRRLKLRFKQLHCRLVPTFLEPDVVEQAAGAERAHHHTVLLHLLLGRVDKHRAMHQVGALETVLQHHRVHGLHPPLPVVYTQRQRLAVAVDDVRVQVLANVDVGST